MKLRKSQKRGIKKIEKFGGRCLLADEMRVGKTRQVLQWAKLHPEARPIIVVCQATPKWEWLRQAAESHIRGVVIEGTKAPKTKPFKIPELLIINYDILTYWVRYLKKLKPQILAIDECQYIKSRRAVRTKAVKKLSKKIPYVIAIGGTPIVNRPAELWPTLNILDPKTYHSFMKFAFRYCDVKRTPYGWDYSGAKNLDELHSILKKTLMIRRLRKDIWKGEPKKDRRIVLLPIRRRSEYEEAVNNFLTWLYKKSAIKAKRAAKAQQLTKLGYLRRLAAELKMKYVIRWVKRFLKKNKKAKLVIYTVHTRPLNRLHKKFRDISVVIDGSTPSKKRKIALQTFQRNKKIRIFIGNIRAASVGIDLSAADDLAFVELSWTPGDHSQAEDRIIKKGKKTPPRIHYLIAKGTIEEYLCKLIQKKQKILTNVLDGKAKVDKLNIFDKLEKMLKTKGFKNGINKKNKGRRKKVHNVS